MSILLELCIDSVESAIAAQAGGADRIELCSDLSVGGITPSAGLIHAVRAAVSLPLCVLIRPRAGHFHYTANEFAVMRDDVLRARDLGVNCVVLGILTPGDSIDIDRTRALVQAARPMRVTFHRAFDLAHHLDQALEDVIATGADRILTSGGQPSAVDGAPRVAQLVKAAGQRIRILGGGGIRTSNVRAFLHATGAREIHTSLRIVPAPSPRHDRISAILGGNSAHTVVAADHVREMRAALDETAAQQR